VKLKNWGIDINDADNGVWLPGSKSPENAPGAYHPRLNNKEYIDGVRRELLSARNADEARARLRLIGEDLQRGEFSGVKPRSK
jgi:hypothetical protein